MAAIGSSSFRCTTPSLQSDGVWPGCCSMIISYSSRVGKRRPATKDFSAVRSKTEMSRLSSLVAWLTVARSRAKGETNSPSTCRSAMSFCSSGESAISPVSKISMALEIRSSPVPSSRAASTSSSRAWRRRSWVRSWRLMMSRNSSVSAGSAFDSPFARAASSDFRRTSSSATRLSCSRFSCWRLLICVFAMARSRRASV